MSIREGFWTLVAAVVFTLLNVLFYVGCFAKAAFDTVFLGKDAAKQLGYSDDDLNGRY